MTVRRFKIPLGFKMLFRNFRNDRGVSLLVEYLLLISVISAFVFIMGYTLNQKLEESQVDVVVENQFSDIASEVSSQLVDMLAVYPRNGVLNAKVFMPKSIGDVEYTVSLRGSYVTIISEFGKHNKSLSLGAAGLLKFNMSGMTHSLVETHELNYSKISPTYPSAVLMLKPAAIYANETVPGHFQIDVSHSSAFGAFVWRVILWNGTELSGDSGDTVKDVYVFWKPSEFQTYCNYNATAETAECNVTLIVTDLRGLRDVDNATILIAKTPSTPPSLYIKKYAKPPQTVPGKPVQLHIYLNGRGFRTTGEAINLSAVTVIDTSGSMGPTRPYEWKTYYSYFAGNVSPTVWVVNYDVGSSWKGRKMKIMAYTTDSMSPWWDSQDKDDAVMLYIYQADGDFYTASREISSSSKHGKWFRDGYISSKEIGTWTFKVLVANPDPVTLYLDIYRWEKVGSKWKWVLKKRFTTTYDASYGESSVYLPAGYTEDDEYAFLRAEMDSKYVNDFRMWLDYTFCEDGICTNYDVGAGTHTITVVPQRLGAQQYEGSVYIEKLDAAKMASIDFINYGLGEKDFAGLVHFSTYATMHRVNSSPYLPYLTTDKDDVMEEIRGLDAGGWTNIYQALNYARDELLYNTTIISGTKPLIVFLTDGKPTCRFYSSGYCSSPDGYTYDSCYYCSGYVCDPDDCGDQLIPLAESIKSTQIDGENITICTIGFGTETDYNATLLEAIASYKPGSNEKCFYTAKDYHQLVDAFKDISTIFKIAARNVTVTDVIPKDVKVLDAEVVINGNAICNTTPDIGKAGNDTYVRVDCDTIYIDDEVELIVTVVANEPGTYYLDVPVISNVTFEGYPFGPANIEVVPLKVVSVRYGGSERAEVRIS